MVQEQKESVSGDPKTDSITVETPDIQKPRGLYASLVDRLKALNIELGAHIVTLIPSDPELGLPEAIFIPDRIESDLKEMWAIRESEVVKRPYQHWPVMHSRARSSYWLISETTTPLSTVSFKNDISPYQYGFVVITEEGGPVLDRSPFMLKHMSRTLVQAQCWEDIRNPDPLVEEPFTREELFRHVQVYTHPDRLPRSYAPEGVPFIRPATVQEFNSALQAARSLVTVEILHEVPAGTPEEYLKVV